MEMGGAASVIFVSYFGSSRHIPGWIGLGAALTGFGALVFTLPHVMAPAYTVTGGLNSSTGTESICRSFVVFLLNTCFCYAFILIVRLYFVTCDFIL